MQMGSTIVLLSERERERERERQRHNLFLGILGPLIRTFQDVSPFPNPGSIISANHFAPIWAQDPSWPNSELVILATPCPDSDWPSMARTDSDTVEIIDDDISSAKLEALLGAMDAADSFLQSRDKEEAWRNCAETCH